MQTVHDKGGKLLPTTEEQKKRCKEHFTEILHRPPPNLPPQLGDGTEQLQICTGQISKAEIRKAFSSLKNRRVASCNSSPPEAWKEALHPLLNMIWSHEYLSDGWKQGRIRAPVNLGLCVLDLSLCLGTPKICGHGSLGPANF